MTESTTPEETKMSHAVRTLGWPPIQIKVFGGPDGLWIQGGQMAKALGYANPYKSLIDHVPEACKCSGMGLTAYADIMRRYEKQSIFINKTGLQHLLSASKLPNKLAFIEYLRKEISFTYNVPPSIGKEQGYIVCLLASFSYCVLRPQYVIGDYRIDLYFPDEKIAVECDEFGHHERNIEDEVEREEFIARTLGCTFVRFDPNEPNFCIFRVIGQIGALVAKTRKTTR